jgi:hypothetical protein
MDALRVTRAGVVSLSTRTSLSSMRPSARSLMLCMTHPAASRPRTRLARKIQIPSKTDK